MSQDLWTSQTQPERLLAFQENSQVGLCWLALCQFDMS